MSKFVLTEVVQLLEDTEAVVQSGSFGTVVEIHGDGKAYEVEFVDDHGDTIAVITVGAEKLKGLPVSG